MTKARLVLGALLAQAGVAEPGRFLSALIHSAVDHALAQAGPSAGVEGFVDPRDA